LSSEYNKPLTVIFESSHPRCCTVAAQVVNEHERHSFLFRVFPANVHISKVEPRGFEPLTSAV
jgi:hypothetical protein